MFVASHSVGVNRWPLVRVQVGGQTRVICLCDKFLPVAVHWSSFGKGRSILCPQQDCPLCSYMPSRGLFYLAVTCFGHASILELGSQASSHLEQHAALLHGGLRAGLEVQLSRRSPKAPLYSEVTGFADGTRHVTLLQFAAKVMALYSLPCPNPDESLEGYQARLLPIVQRRAEMEDRRQAASVSEGVKGR